MSPRIGLLELSLGRLLVGAWAVLLLTWGEPVPTEVVAAFCCVAFGLLLMERLAAREAQR